MGRRSDIKPLPSVERLDELLSYDETSGLLTWKMLVATSRSNICHNNKCGGKVAGTVNDDGYVVIGIAKKYYLAHRIIWKLMTGFDPTDLVDHRDTDRGNNRWANLREAENGPNIQNSKIRKDNKSGIKGVHWDKHHNSWKATLSVNGQQIPLGRHKRLEDAAKVRRDAAERLHGEFARVA